MSELNREQIIKALECCASSTGSQACIGCPLDELNLCSYDGTTPSKYALALIKELAEENERLNERLGREARCQYDLCGQIVNLRDDVKYIKADTVRKMQKRLCEDRVSNDPVVIAVNVIAKEMLEG